MTSTCVPYHMLLSQGALFISASDATCTTDQPSNRHLVSVVFSPKCSGTSTGGGRPVPKLTKSENCGYGNFFVVESVPRADRGTGRIRHLCCAKVDGSPTIQVGTDTRQGRWDSVKIDSDYAVSRLPFSFPPPLQRYGFHKPINLSTYDAGGGYGQYPGQHGRLTRKRKNRHTGWHTAR